MLYIPRRLRQFLTPGCANFTQHYAPEPLSSQVFCHRHKNSSSDLPRISVVIPSFNQGEFIGKTIQSIIEQEYSNLELIVIDGGSTDNSIEVIESFEDSISYWVSESDNGQCHAINKGMAQATGAILAWLNSDDVYLNHSLWKVAYTFMDNPKVDVIYGHRIIINESGQDIGKWILPGHAQAVLDYADYVPQETMYWRKELWKKVGGNVDESFSFALDWDLILRFIEVGARFKVVDAFLGGFRRHEQQKTSAMIESAGFAEMDRLRLRCARNKRGLASIPYRLMGLHLTLFMIRARLYEVLWKIGLVEID